MTSEPMTPFNLTAAELAVELNESDAYEDYGDYYDIGLRAQAFLTSPEILLQVSGAGSMSG